MNNLLPKTPRCGHVGPPARLSRIPSVSPAPSCCSTGRTTGRGSLVSAAALALPDGPLGKISTRRVLDRVDVFADARQARPSSRPRTDGHADASCLVVRPVLSPARTTTSAVPYLLWLPDIDGVGMTCKRQWAALNDAFDFYMLKTMPRNRMSFDSMVQVAVAHVQAKLADMPVERTAYLVGEGLGALIALAVAAKCSREISRLVLINPGTSYPGSTLAAVGPLMARLPPALYNTMAVALSPVLGDPLRIVAHAVKEHLPGRATGHEDVLPELHTLIANLPTDTLLWRLNVAAEAVKHVRQVLPGIEQRTCIIAGGKDALLPSQQEAHRLASILPRAFAKVLPECGHSMLQDKAVDFMQLLQQEGFYNTCRAFTSPPPKDGGASLGPAGPVELPTVQEVARYAARWTAPMRRLSSPFFVSTLEDGSLVPGLEGVPGAGCKGPIIFVGNHQILGVDMNVMVEEVYLQKGLLLRGLAHPGLMRNNHHRAGVDRDLRSIAFDFSNVIKTFGAVPVTPTNFYRLLQRQEAILLFPGGVREGFKRKNEKYKLFWPSKSEFVRMAAKFGATIVPVASIGAEDSVNIVMDTDDIRRHSFLGPIAEEFAAQVPDARVGVAESEDLDHETFIMPLAAPTVPARLYYMFRKPITLQAADAKDKLGCDETYAHIKQEVEEGISYLIRMREQDPYKSFIARCVYENASGRQRIAPSFVPQQEHEVHQQ